MNKKYLLIILPLFLILIIIAGGVLFWFSKKPTPSPPVPSPFPQEPKQPERIEERETETEDDIISLLNSLEKETEIDFPDIRGLEIRWIVEVEPEVKEESIEGRGFEIKKVSRGQVERVKSFFKKRGFEMDIHNIADGTIGSLVGFKRGQLVCIVAEGATGYKEATGQWIPPEPEKRDMDVGCGLL